VSWGDTANSNRVSLQVKVILEYVILKEYGHCVNYFDDIKLNLRSNVPNIHTSLAAVNLLKLIDSGAIHLIGSLPLEAENRIRQSN
jgi:hypothetical protein